MKKPLKNAIMLISGIILGLLILFLYSQFLTAPSMEEIPPHMDPQRDGVFITAISGEVYILRGDETIIAQPGQSLLPDDVLKVVDDSYCQVQFAQQGTATVNSNTLLKLQQFLNAQKEQDIRTEILMGSMLYRVHKNEGLRNFQVESEGVIYDITGTEFLLSRSPSGTRLTVTEGSVVLKHNQEQWQEQQANEGQEFFIPTGGKLPERQAGISQEQSQRLEQLAGLSQLELQEEEEVVLIALRTRPDGGQIYLAGRLIGQGQFQGLFAPGQELRFLIRKRGYQDESLTIVVDSEEDQLHQIDLIPLPLEESLEQEAAVVIENPLQELQDQWQQQLNNQQQELNRLEGRVDSLKEQRQQQIQAEAELRQELDNREEEVSRLKDLIRQIQDLADQ